MIVHGDVAGLRALARALTAAATPVSSAGSTTDGRLSALVQHGWRGDAATAMSGRWATQLPRFNALADHFTTVGRALDQYASAVESAQRIVMQGRAAAAAAGLLLDLDGNASLPSYVMLMPVDHQTALRTALQAAQRADSAALEQLQAAEAALFPALHGVLESLVAEGKPEEGKETPGVREQIDHLNRMLGWLLSPVATGLAVREGQVWTTSLAAWNAAPASTKAALFSDIVGSMGLQYDRGEATLADLEGAFQRYGNAADAVDAFDHTFDPSYFEDLRTGGVPETGALGVAGKLFAGLGVLSDVGVLVNPGVSNGTEAGLDRTAAGLNLAGTAAVFAPEATATAITTVAGVAGLDASVGWVPVAGQVVVVASGLYLAGDWAYNNLKPFHDAVDATGHVIADGAKAVWHAGGAVVDGAEHVAGDVAHALNPLNW